MDALSVAASIIGAVDLTIRSARLASQLTYNTFEILTLRALRRSFSELCADYGVIQAILLFFIFPDARDVLRRIQRHLLKPHSDLATAMEEALALKKALSDDCTMLAVAAAIMAQVAITAMSLEDMSSVHWIAKAAFVVSLAAGALSVFFACILQQRISSLFGLSDIKDWMIKPANLEALKFANHILDARPVRNANQPISEEEPWQELENQITQIVKESRWVQASFNTALMIKVPALLLHWSVVAFLVGLGVYLGSFWDKSLGAAPSRGDSLGILVAYIIATAFGLLIFYVPTILKYLEGAPVRRLLDRLAGPANPRGTSSESRADIKLDKIYERMDLDPSDTTKGRNGLDASEYVEISPRSPRGVRPTALQTQLFDPRTGINEGEAAAFEQPGLQPHDQSSTSTAQASTSRTATAEQQPAEAQTDPLIAALEASIAAQEQSIAAFRALLQEHNRTRDRENAT